MWHTKLGQHQWRVFVHPHLRVCCFVPHLHFAHTETKWNFDCRQMLWGLLKKLDQLAHIQKVKGMCYRAVFSLFFWKPALFFGWLDCASCCYVDWSNVLQFGNRIKNPFNRDQERIITRLYWDKQGVLVICSLPVFSLLSEAYVRAYVLFQADAWFLQQWLWVVNKYER